MATERSFSDFLSNMNEQTNSKPKYTAPESIEEDDDYVEDIEDEDIEEERKNVPRSESRNENSLDIMEKSLEYTRSVIKVIKENFSSKEQRMILETLRNTINMSLGDQQVYQESSPVRQQQAAAPQRMIKNENASPMLQGTAISEEEWNRMGDGEEQISPPPQPRRNAHAAPYKRELNLGMKMGPSGKPEVDISKITSQDINEMKLLAGIK